MLQVFLSRLRLCSEIHFLSKAINKFTRAAGFHGQGLQLSQGYHHRQDQDGVEFPVGRQNLDNVPGKAGIQDNKKKKKKKGKEKERFALMNSG